MLVKPQLDLLLKKNYAFEFCKLHSFVELSYHGGGYMAGEETFETLDQALHWLKIHTYRYSRVIVPDPNECELVVDWLRTVFG